MEFQTIAWNESTYRQLVAYLEKNADESYRIFNSRIVKSSAPKMCIRDSEASSVVVCAMEELMLSISLVSRLMVSPCEWVS